MVPQKIYRRTETGELKLVIRPPQECLLPTYRALKQSKTDYNIVFGSGGSGKSHALAQYFTARLMKNKETLLVTRKYGTSLSDSVIEQFVAVAFPFFGLENKVDYTYNITKRRIKFNKSGSVIIFRGVDNPEKIKSITGITLVWIEEATELSENDFTILSDRIRGNPQIYLSFNPISERHWLKTRFELRNPTKNAMFEVYQPNPRTSVIFSTYHVNPFVGRKFREDMAWYKQNRPDHYRIYGLGEWGIIRPLRPFFTTIKPTLNYGEARYNPALPICLTWDFNVSNTCLVSQHYDDEYVSCVKLYHGEGDLREICHQIINDFGNLKEYYFSGDASGNNQSAYTPGNQSAYELIQSYFREVGAEFLNFSAVPKANGETAQSRTIANAIVSYLGHKLVIDRDNCGLLIDDIDRMQANYDGSLDKNDADKNDYGHAGDTFRYMLKHFCLHIYLKIRENYNTFDKISAA